MNEKVSGAGEDSAKRSSRNRRLFEFGQTLPFVGGNGPVDDRAAIDAFPGIEDEEEVGKPLHHHQPFAFRTVHDALQISIVSPIS